jgi:hypothetical protein
VDVTQHTSYRSANSWFNRANSLFAAKALGWYRQQCCYCYSQYVKDLREACSPSLAGQPPGTAPAHSQVTSVSQSPRLSPKEGKASMVGPLLYLHPRFLRTVSRAAARTSGSLSEHACRNAGKAAGSSKKISARAA